MRYGKLCFLGLSAIAILGSGLPALSQESNSETQKSEQPKPQEVEASASPASGEDCFSGLKDIQIEAQIPPLRSKRVELYYYRNKDFWNYNKLINV